MNIPSRRALALGSVALLAIGGFGWVVATQGPLAPVEVTVAPARETALDRALFGIATVEARRSYNLGPTAAGRVARVLVDQGDPVAPGQVVAEMDPVDLEERLAASGAAAGRARELARAAAAAVQEAASRAQVARSSAERYADLRRRNFVSQEAADARRHEANAGQSALAAAEAALAAARGEVQRTEAELAAAGKARANLRMTSPVAGIVAARLAEPGTTLVAGQAVLQIVDPASLWVRARLDQARSAGLAPGLPAEVALRSRPGRVFAGTVARVDLVGDAIAEERLAHVVLREPPPDLTLGELAEVTVHLPSLPGALAIPAAAVKRLGAQEGAWLLDSGGRPAFRPLALGERSLDGLTRVLSGLAAGETVVVHSSRTLAPELRVKVVDSLLRGPR